MTTTHDVDVRGDPVQQERDHLVLTHVELAYTLARRFMGRGEELDDLRQVALLALVQAAERFEPERGYAFTTYATPTILGALKRHFRDHGWAIRPPRRLQERYLETVGVIEFLTGELQRYPTNDEVADRGGWSEAEVREARAQQAWRSVDHWELDDDGDAGHPGVIDDGFEHVEADVLIDDLLGGLTERDRHILEMRFFGGLTQADIGRHVGLSQMHVGRLVKTSCNELRSLVARAAPSSERLRG